MDLRTWPLMRMAGKTIITGFPVGLREAGRKSSRTTTRRASSLRFFFAPLREPVLETVPVVDRKKQSHAKAQGKAAKKTITARLPLNRGQANN
jgi:hypothetical protein